LNGDWQSENSFVIRECVVRPDEGTKELFAQALEKKTLAEREKFLAAACHGELELRQQVETLLRASEQAGDFLGQTMPLPTPDFLSQPSGTASGGSVFLRGIRHGWRMDG